MSFYTQTEKEFDELQAARLLQTSALGRRLAWWVATILIISIITMFMPWRQTIRGTGTLTALSPKDRPQTVNSTLDGRIVEWYVGEGETVEAGDSILRIEEVKDKFFDPSYLKRLGEQLTAKQEAAIAYQQKIDALSQQIAALQSAQDLSLQKARNKILQAGFKVSADSAAMVAAKMQVIVADTQFKRQQQLYDQGLKSLTDLESRRIKLQEASAKLNEASNKLLTSRNDRINSIIEISSLGADYAEKIAKATSDKSSAMAYLNDLQGTIAKMQNEIINTEVRQGYYIIRAPREGRVVKALKEGLGEMVKAGESIVTVVPENPNLAVALYVKANDLPLLSVGNKVRLQFDGWPALQFSGWPGASFGTFGGRISVVDYVAYEKNKYRVLISPDETDEPWPDKLRIGSGAMGWALLDQVPLWYEIWRQMNGFPPSLYEENPMQSSMSGEKGPKIKGEAE